MNLFLEARKLTDSKEDMLTCFVAAGLDSDPAFRAAYEEVVLAKMAKDGRVPAIESVSTQVWYPEHHSQPDMMLTLEDGRRVACEHKLDAGETVYEGVLQLERYLGLPDVAAVAYFRTSYRPPDAAVLCHPAYLCPPDAVHFLWRDLYRPLQAGTHPVCRWLCEAFETFGFTPAIPHLGDLWPNEDPVVRRNQENFGKLWQSTRGRFNEEFTFEVGSRCELYLTPRRQGLVSCIWLDPRALKGTHFRIRAYTDDAGQEAVRTIMMEVEPVLPVRMRLSEGLRPNGTWGIDLLVPLAHLLGEVLDAKEQEARLFQQVTPVVEALTS